jgi:SAM-dependent methyltransferase
LDYPLDLGSIADVPEELASWKEGTYVADWVGDDVLADLLELPRRISAALVDASGAEVEHVVDLGSGHGPYLELLLDTFPQARGTWVDSSAPMEPLAREALERFGDRISYVLGDIEDLPSLGLGRAQLIVSSRAIHHFSHDSIRGLYGAAFDVLTDEGWFFNLDHFGTPSDWKKRYRAIRDRFTGRRKEQLRPHREPFELTVPETQIAWLREVGFDADIPWRTFFTALLAARKAPAS